MVIYGKLLVDRQGVMLCLWRVAIGIMLGPKRISHFASASWRYKIVRVWRFFISEWIPPHNLGSP
jgi:hypothetical protein